MAADLHCIREILCSVLKYENDLYGKVFLY